MGTKDKKTKADPPETAETVKTPPPEPTGPQAETRKALRARRAAAATAPKRPDLGPDQRYAILTDINRESEHWIAVNNRDWGPNLTHNQKAHHHVAEHADGTWIFAPLH